MAKSDTKQILEIVKSLSTKVDTLEKCYGSLDRGYDRLNVAINGLKADGKGLRAEMTQLKNDLMTKMDSLASTFSNHDETILMLKARTFRHEEDITILKKKVGVK